MLKEAVGLAYAHAVYLSDIFPFHPKIERLTFEPRPLALRAQEIGAVAREKDPHMHPVAFPL